MAQRYRWGVGVLLAGLASCGGAAKGGDAREGVTRANAGNVVVVSGAQLSRSGGDLLEALVGRVSSLRIDRRQLGCPTVSLRGQKTILGNQNAAIYVEGTQAADTCILRHLRVGDVERVEVYPSGFTDRPGYGSNPNGLILVFLTGADSHR